MAERPPGLTPVTVRPLGDAQVEAVVDMLAAVVAEGRWLGQEPPFDRDEALGRFRADLESGGRRHRIAMVNGEVVGHVGIEVASYGVASMSMFVAARWRRRGAGSALVADAVAVAREEGAHKITLQMWPHNAAGRALYDRHGFVDEGLLRRHYPRRDGALWDAVIMGLVLDETSPGGPPT